jgi:hypothetical protein
MVWGMPQANITVQVVQQRATVQRTAILKEREARVVELLIPQSCAEQSVPLVTRDRHVRHGAAAAGLPLR